MKFRHILRFLWALIERRGDDLRLDRLPTNLDSDFRAELGVRQRHIREADVFLDERAW